jgi:hypothetical protein
MKRNTAAIEKFYSFRNAVAFTQCIVQSEYSITDRKRKLNSFSILQNINDRKRETIAIETIAIETIAIYCTQSFAHRKNW